MQRVLFPKAVKHLGWQRTVFISIFALFFFIGGCGNSANLTSYANTSNFTLDQTDVGPQYKLLVDTTAGPTQRTHDPLPYQKDFVGGHFRYYMTNAALATPGSMQITSWENDHNIPITTPFITIIGPFVSTHTGIFLFNSEAIEYNSAGSAAKDYHCCTFDYKDSLTNFQSIPIEIGDESNAHSGVILSPDPDPTHNMQDYYIRWRQGNVVAFISILGAHDIQFSQALQFAQIVEQRIKQEAA